jgi:hypothetical protein
MGFGVFTMIPMWESLTYLQQMFFARAGLEKSKITKTWM